MIQSNHPWSDYMRAKFREHGILQQEVFLAADGRLYLYDIDDCCEAV